MTDILSMINRLQDTAIDFTLSGRERDRDELHAARRAIMEAFEAKTTSAPELPEAAFRLCESAKLVDAQGNGAMNYVVAPYLVDDLRRALSAAAKPATAVCVQALEWTSEPPYSVARVPSLYLLYSTECVWNEGKFEFCQLSGNCVNKVFPTLEAAKTAAQADYEARIRSALTPPSPAIMEREAELVKALEPFARHADRYSEDEFDDYVPTNCVGSGDNIHLVTMGDFRRARAAIDPSLEQE